MNYGETLVYWYLRLNGFFPLRNFVLHRLQPPRGNRENADVDLLAVRFPFVRVYGDPSIQNRQGDDDWDEKLKDLLPDLTRTITGLIVEVKTSDPGNLSSFAERRIRADIERLGFFAQQAVVNQVTDNLLGRAIVTEGQYCIGKLLVSEDEMPGAWMNLTMAAIDEFIGNRMKKYIDPKYAARGFFPDDLIQYIIWRENMRSKKADRRDTCS